MHKGRGGRANASRRAHPCFFDKITTSIHGFFSLGSLERLSLYSSKSCAGVTAIFIIFNAIDCNAYYSAGQAVSGAQAQ